MHRIGDVALPIILIVVFAIALYGCCDVLGLCSHGCVSGVGGYCK